MKNNSVKFNDGWCFATVNGRLAEIYFDKKRGIFAHCYIDKKEYNKSEQKMIASDIKKYKFVYRNGYYFDKIQKVKHKKVSIYKIFPEIRKI
ncbi:MAG: hypothetical protein WC587_00840 [Candidatus Paceibacterota bacterium]